MTGIALATQISSASLGSAKELTKDLDDKQEVFLGSIIGKVRGLSYRNNPQDPDSPAIALTGMFEAVPADAEKEAAQSARCYIQPQNVQDIIIQLVISEADPKAIAGAPKKSPPKGKSYELGGAAIIPISLEIYAVKSAGSPVGYMYKAVMLNKVAGAEDGLADLRALLPKGERKQPARIATERTTKALPAPRKKAKK